MVRVLVVLIIRVDERERSIPFTDPRTDESLSCVDRIAMFNDFGVGMARPLLPARLLDGLHETLIFNAGSCLSWPERARCPVQATWPNQALQLSRS